MKSLKTLLLGAVALSALAACQPAANNDNATADKPASESAAPAGSLSGMKVDIPYEKFTLPNGLTVIVHEDRKAPIVSVGVWYHVGSKDEPAGKTGFAHLFEHIMFNGSENFDGEVFVPLESIGGKDLNGTTWFDRTNYFETVPTPALDVALFLESDRMGHLLGAVTQEKLTNQIGVVQNEKRQGDSQPFGKVEYAQLEGLFPPGHPYRHSTIGSMEDLSNASLDDVKAWFAKYYGAANTVLVLSGDIDAATAKPLVEKYFGDIGAGEPLTKMKSFVPVKEANQVEEMIDRVPNTRIYRTWAVPGRAERDAYLLDLAAGVLAGGKNSRLYQELVYKSQLAANVSAHMQPFEITSLFEIQVDMKPGASPEDVAKAEAILDGVMADYLENGPKAEELSRAQTASIAGTVRGLESIGGFGGKGVALAQGQLYAGDPNFVATIVDWQAKAGTADVAKASRDWIGKGYYQLTVKPYDTTYRTIATDLDRKKGLPEVGDMPSLKLPAIQQATLKNGMKLVLVERHTVPVVEVALQFDAGYAADAGAKLGTAKFTLSMLDEGTESKTALEVAEEAEKLGAEIGSSSNLDVSQVRLSALKPNLDASLDLFADVVRHPAFSDEELDRLRGRWLAGIAQEKADLMPIALRVLPGLVYGDDHAYSVPYSGSGTEESIKTLTRDDLVNFHQNWLRPDNATVFVVGDIGFDEAIKAVEKAFGDWAAPAVPKPEKNLGHVAAPKGNRVVIIDKPDSPSTMVVAAKLVPGTGAEDSLVLDTANDILGGEFTARINMNIREDKGWSYYAYSSTLAARGDRMWIAYSPIQTDKTVDGLKEMLKEISDYTDKRPATEAELDKMKDTRINALPGAIETSGDVMGDLLQNDRFGRPYNHAETLKERFSSMDLDAIRAAADTYLKPEGLTWVLVGDRAKIEKGVRDLGLGEVSFLDVDGNPVE
ncbi:M16 family metallopeptidase [Pseudokordiimonas caeni]|uniref:M16 family metallopeptidase n=1 Tax=Pseudokordiimonas caeni TaxID=2997908 RepID=UPI00281153DE|nr:insulinase family protein [Pseudokordiimonas caeni]